MSPLEMICFMPVIYNKHIKLALNILYKLDTTDIRKDDSTHTSY